MPRPRKALWESSDKAVYITQHSRGFLIVDTRGTRTERFRASLHDAMEVAVATSTGPVGEITFFELIVLLSRPWQKRPRIEVAQRRPPLLRSRWQTLQA